MQKHVGHGQKYRGMVIGGFGHREIVKKIFLLLESMELVTLTVLVPSVMIMQFVRQYD